MMQTLFAGRYAIHLGDCWEALNAFLDRSAYSSLFVLVDENTQEYCLPTLLERLSVAPRSILVIPPGEVHKDLEQCRHIWEGLLAGNADRRSLLINLGGGVVGDLGGFCAGTYKRGIDFVQAPTTLLAQVDASIGGKLGFDLNHVKNAIGLFQDPAAVFIYPPFLETLPARERKSGFAEMLKHALIADAEYWEALKALPPSLLPEALAPHLLTSLEIKKQIVRKDPKEQGLRKALNFGHTIGHAVESWALGSADPLLHGEAIAIGMVCEAFLSWKAGLLQLEALEAIAPYLAEMYPRRKLSGEPFSTFRAWLEKDKKSVGDTIRFSLIGPIGQAHIDQTCPEEHIRESFLYYDSL